jgi:heme a synthase
MTFATQTKFLSFWLFTCCALIVAMITVGAVTRLTESGLSIVEWHAVKDMALPGADAAWRDAFAKYQETPEYLQKNRGMTIADFKRIYFWEWLHRLLGRVIGLAYAVPLVAFWLAKKIPDRLKPRFVAFLLLGGAQGFIGWFMVKSGLIDEPRVSHFRLAAHLLTALLLLGLLWLQALALRPAFVEKAAIVRKFVSPSLRTHFRIGLGFLLVTVLWGAFTAGLDAGLACDDFPTTCGQFLPRELFFQNAFWRNIVHEPVAVQFTHRLFGTVTFLLLFTLGIRLLKTRLDALKKTGLFLHILILLQWCLGIGTIQSHVALPLAALHQLGAVATLLVMLTLLPAMARKNILA